MAREPSTGILVLTRKGRDVLMIVEQIASLIKQAKKEGHIEPRDEIYVQNQLIELFHLKEFPNQSIKISDDSIPNLLENLVELAVEEKIINDLFDEKEMFAAKVMNCF